MGKPVGMQTMRGEPLPPREATLLLRIERGDGQELRVERVRGGLPDGSQGVWHQLSTWSRAANAAYRQSAVVTLRADELGAVLTVLCREHS